MEPSIESKLSIQYILLSLLFGICLVFISYIPTQEQFLFIIIPYVIAFFVYLFIISRKLDKRLINFLLIIAIATRFAILFSVPNLSDDVYRFIWDGRLWQAGMNAYGYLPTEVFEASEGLSAELFSELNSQQYYTIYPPICQLVFYLATLPFWTGLMSQVIILKGIMFLAELASIFLIINILRRLKLNISRTLIYALNPLIILEITGNLHFEGILICFFLLFYLFAIKKQLLKSSIFFALSISAKLLPLMFIPLLLKRLSRDELLKFLGVLSIFLILLFSPVIAGFKLIHFGESLDLYFRKFEFNGNLYYVLRWIGLKLSGYNLIQFVGPGLGLIAVGSIVYLGLKKQRNLKWDSFPKYALIAFSIYLLSATTIHPWYLSLPIVLCLFTDYRFPIIWSGLIFLTYINYSYLPYSENLWVVAIEYIIVLFFVLKEFTREYLSSPLEST